MAAILAITDGDTRIELTGTSAYGVRLLEWLPHDAPIKTAVWSSSPVHDGQYPRAMYRDNATETLRIAVCGTTQDAAIATLRRLRRLLQSAREYWTSYGTQGTWVWLEARSQAETYTRYAPIVDYRLEQEADLYGSAFAAGVMDELTLVLTRLDWRDTPQVQTADWITLSNQYSVVLGTPEETLSMPSIPQQALLRSSTGRVIVPIHDGSIRYSDDMGQTWNTASTHPPSAIVDLCEDLAHYRLVAYCTDGDIYGSNDDGDTWALLATGVGSPYHQGICYVGWLQGILLADLSNTGNVLVSYDGGSTWSLYYDVASSLYRAGWTICNPAAASVLVMAYSTEYMRYRTYLITSAGVTVGDSIVTIMLWLTAWRNGYFLAEDDMYPSAATHWYTEDGHWQQLAVNRPLPAALYADDEYIYYGSDVIRRSADGYEWETIAELPSAGYANMTRSMSRAANYLLIASALSGTGYVYRLPLDIDLGVVATDGVASIAASIPSIITHASVYDASVSSWTSLDIAAGGELLPFPIEAGDALLLSSDTDVRSLAGRFACVGCNIEVPAQGQYTTAWYYSVSTEATWPPAAPGWAELTVTDETAASNHRSLSLDGVNTISFTPPSNWTYATINGVTGYHIACVVQSVSGTCRPAETGAPALWAVRHNGVAVAEVGGDLPALLRVKARNSSGVCNHRILLALRSKSRGADFHAIINCADVLVPFGLTVSCGGQSSFVNSEAAPVGRAVSYTCTVANTWSDEVTIAFSDTVAQEYFGRYRCFARVTVASVSQPFRARIKVIGGSDGIERIYSDSVVTSTDSYYLLDLGQVNIPPSHDVQEMGDVMSLILQLYAAAGVTATIYDIILLPADEAIGDYYCTDSDRTGWTYQRRVSVDASRVPRPITCTLRDIADRVVSIWVPATAAPFVLPPTGQSICWWLAATLSDDVWVSSPYTTCELSMQAIRRYISARGGEQ